MIVNELVSAFSKSQDLLFVYWAYGLVMERLQTRKDGNSRLALQMMGTVNSRFFLETKVDLNQLIKTEKGLLGRRDDLEAFLRTGNPYLSSFVPKPKTSLPFEVLGLRVAPAFMAEWNASSRRVFQLGTETQQLLEVIDHKELELDDLVIPFPNFVVRLATPIAYGGKKYTAVGFSQEVLAQEAANGDGASWSYVLLSDDSEYETLTEKKKKKLVEDMGKTKKTGDVLGTLVGMMSIRLGNITTPHIRIPIKGTLIPSTDEIQSVKSEDTENLRKLHSVMVNLMAMMGQLGKSGSPSKSVNEEPPQGVSSTENVFDISGLSSLGDVIDTGSPTNDPTCNPAGRKITPHWRRKHLRRRPGMGHIPEAPKDVKVPATLVLGDFLESGTLPVGGITKI